MKKMITLLLVLVLACGLVMSVAAEDSVTASVSTDKAVYEAGEVITVTVTLNETIAKDDGVFAFQNVLTYNDEYLEVVIQGYDEDLEEDIIGTVGENYADLEPSLSASKAAPEIKFNWFNTGKKKTEIPAGVMFTMQFKALKDVSAEKVEAVLSLTCLYADKFSVPVYNLTAEAKFAICPGHEAGEAVKSDEKAADCTNAGSYVSTTYCKHCDAVMATETVTVPATGHTMVAGAVTAPTCTEAGYTTYTCSDCGATEKKDEVPATGHTEATDAAVPATCTSTGLTEGKHCSVCNTVLVKQEETAKLDHTWDAGTVTTAPTCTEKGAKTFKCACGETKTEELPANGHTEVVDAAVAPTCTATGLTEGKHCSVCNTVLVKQEVVATVDHTWDAGVVTTEPTCTAEGVKTYTCACGETKTEAIPAAGHTWDEGVYTDPTTESDGYWTYTCACGETKVVVDEGSAKDEPPKTGDVVSCIAAVALVAAMSVVALPKAKKY